MTEQRDAAELQIRTPCPKTWDALEGDERRRFCSQCELHVHNSAALTRDEARELVSESAGRVCMRIVRDGQGAAVYRDPTVAPSALGRAARWALAAGAGLLAACRGDAGEAGPETSPVLGGQNVEASMGVVCPREELGDVLYPSDHEGSGVPVETPVEAPVEAPVELLGEVCVDPETPPGSEH